MNIIFSRELPFTYDAVLVEGTNFKEDIKEIFDEIINGEEMKEYEYLDITLNNTTKEEDEIIRNYVGFGVDFDLNRYVSINKAIRGNIEVFNITLNQKESEAMRETFYDFYPYTYTQVSFTFGTVLKDIINAIKNNSLDINSYTDYTKTLLNQELETKLQRLLIKKLHEKGFIYDSEFVEEGKKLSPEDIKEKYKEELLYRFKLFNDKNMYSKITRTEIILPYNHADITIQDRYGIYNIRLYASKDGFLYTHTLDTPYEDYDYGEYSYIEFKIEDKNSLLHIIEETRKAVNKYLEDIS